MVSPQLLSYPAPSAGLFETEAARFWVQNRSPATKRKTRKANHQRWLAFLHLVSTVSPFAELQSLRAAS
jgi:hypothetical protein